MTTAAVGYGATDRTLASIGLLQDRVATFQQQTTTGKVSQSFAGLGGAASQVLDLTATKARAASYDQVIADAQGKAAVIQNVLSQIGSAVGTVTTAALGLVSTSPASSVASVAQQAGSAFAQVASLLNTQYQGQYLFSGADTANPAVPDAADATSSALFTKIGAAVGALASVPTTPALDAVIASTVATAGSTDPATSIFSSYLNGAGAGTATAKVQVSDTQSVTLGVIANRNVAGVTSDPAIGGTGSAMSDILRGLAVLANSSAAMSANPDFAALVRNATSTLGSANQTLTEQAGSVGQTQVTLTAAASASSSFQIVLSKQLSKLTDVDMAAAISGLQAVSDQLEASYKVLSLASGLHLASYL